MIQLKWSHYPVAVEKHEIPSVAGTENLPSVERVGAVLGNVKTGCVGRMDDEAIWEYNELIPENREHTRIGLGQLHY